MYRGDGLNLHAYCANNPVIYYAPSGYTAWDDIRATIKGMGMTRDNISREYHAQYGYSSSKIIYKDKNGNVYTYGDPQYRLDYVSGILFWKRRNAGISRQHLSLS